MYLSHTFYQHNLHSTTKRYEHTILTASTMKASMTLTQVPCCECDTDAIIMTGVAAAGVWDYCVHKNILVSDRILELLCNKPLQLLSRETQCQENMHIKF